LISAPRSTKKNEQRSDAGSGYAPGQEGQLVVSPLRGRLHLRDEAARLRGQGFRPDSFGHDHGYQCHDLTPAADLLHDDEEVVYADAV